MNKTRTDRRRIDELKARLAELAALHESALREMDDIQEQLEEAGEAADDVAAEGQAAARSDELTDLEEKYRTVLADYQNFQRRSRENEKFARTDGASRVIEALLPSLDHLQLALDVGPDTPAETVIGGVRVIRDEIIQALATQGLQLIEPARGEAFDPERHEAVTQIPAGDVEPGHVVESFQAGSVLGSRVLRPAKVAIATPGPAPGTPGTPAPGTGTPGASGNG